MLKQLAISLLLLLVACEASGAISVVATTHKAGQANGVTTDAIDTSGANLIVVSVSWYRQVGDPTISDNRGNTYTGLTQRGASNTNNRLYYCASPTVGSGHTFTVSGTNTYAPISVVAASGAHATPFDVENGSAGASGTSRQPGSLTPSENGCLIVSGVTSSGSSHSLDSGFTYSQNNYSVGVSMGGGCGYLIQGTAAGVNPTWSWTTSSYNAATIASFKPAAGGGGSIVPILQFYLNRMGVLYRSPSGRIVALPSLDRMPVSLGVR